MPVSPTPLTAGSGLARRWIFSVTVVLTTVGLVLPWWRNHSILRDFYDYGLVMAAACRMSLGELPYVDFLTPIQTLHFRLAELAETVFGARYLSLTYANALFIVAVFLGLLVLLVRPLGRNLALIVAAAIVTATAGQHTIVWHNAMGVVWVAVVIGLTARPRPAGSSEQWWRWLLVGIFLWLAGMTKLTYLATALAFAGLFAIRDGWLGTHSWRRVGLALVSYGCFGLVAPVVTEMNYTGATFHQWLYNVVQMPTSRVELLRAMGTLKFYLHTPHDYYLPLYFPFVGAWGLGVLGVLGALAWRQTANVQSRGRTVSFLAVLLAGSWVCGGVLLATNYDIAYVSGAAWLVFGLGVVLAMPPSQDGRPDKSLRITLGLAAVSLLVPAWQAAWSGTRALWDTSPLVRTELVSTNGLPEKFAYFHGMKIPSPLLVSIQSFAAHLDELAARDIPPRTIYLGNAAEWLVRAVPEARHHGLPLWLRDGTTFGEPEARVMNQLLANADEIRAVISLEGWNLWYHQTDWYLKTRFKRERYGPMFNVYLKRKDLALDWQDPVTFTLETNSTAFARDLTVDGGPVALCLRPEGNFLGAQSSMTLAVKQPIDRMRGEWVVRRIAPANGHASTVHWQAVAVSPQGIRAIVQQGRVELDRLAHEKTARFDLDLGGKFVVLEMEVPAGEHLEAGLRALQTDYPSEAIGTMDQCPLDQSLAAQPSSPAWGEALFATAALRATRLEGAALAISADAMPEGLNLMVHTPGQVWFKIGPQFKGLRGKFGLREVAWTQPTALAGIAAKVVYYRPGHLEVLFSQEIRPRAVEKDRAPQSFQVALPGEAAWIGLLFSTLDPPHNAFGQSWWSGIEAW